MMSTGVKFRLILLSNSSLTIVNPLNLSITHADTSLTIFFCSEFYLNKYRNLSFNSKTRKNMLYLLKIVFILKH